jgi:hypothetical protein
MTRHRWWLPAAAVLLLAAGCAHQASPGVASTGAGTARASASASGTHGSALAYSRCMRAHGVKDFPDPNGDGELELNAGPGSDIDPNNPTYKTADAACKSLLPPQQAPPAGLKEANLKYSKCMRSHGVSDFPDPSSDGTLQLQSKPGGDLDPNNPTYKAADAACKHLQLGGGGDGKLSSRGPGS